VGVPHEVDVVCGHAEELAAAGLAHQVEGHAEALQTALQILGVLRKTPKNKSYGGAVLDVNTVFSCLHFSKFSASGQAMLLAKRFSYETGRRRY
jgi:hypothetical protein